MFRPVVAASLLLLATSLSAHNEKPLRILYGDETLDQIDVEGPLYLDGTIVNDFVRVDGPVKAENAKIANLYIRGPAVITLTTVLDTLKCRGTLKAEQSLIGTLIVDGNGELINCKVMKDASITDNLTSIGSVFKGTLTVMGEHTYLEDTKIQSLAAGGAIGKPQIVTLSGTTTIEGNVTFLSGYGHLIIQDGAHIKGTVKGVMVDQENSPSQQ